MGFRDARRARDDADAIAIGRDRHSIANDTLSSPPREDCGAYNEAPTLPFLGSRPSVPLGRLPWCLALCWLIRRVLLGRVSKADAGGGGQSCNEESHDNIVVNNLHGQISQLEEDHERREAALLEALDAEAALGHEAMQRAVGLKKQLSESQNKNSELEKRNGVLEERSRGLEEENARLDKEMERLVEEMADMCKEIKEIGGLDLERMELEFGEGGCGNSLLQESLTDISDDVDGEDDDDSSWTESKEGGTGGTELQVTEFQSKIEELQLELDSARATIANMLSELSSVKGENGKLQEQLDHLNSSKERTFSNGDLTPSITEVTLGSLLTAEESHASSPERKLDAERLSSTAMLAEANGRLEEATRSNTHLKEQVLSLQTAKADAKKQLHKLGLALEESESRNAAIKEEAATAKLQLSNEVVSLTKAKAALEDRVATLEQNLKAEELVVAAKLAELFEARNHVKCLQSTDKDAARSLRKKEAALEEARLTIAAMKEGTSSATLQLLEEVTDLRRLKCGLEDQVASLEIELSSEKLAAYLAEAEGKLKTTALEHQLEVAKDKNNARGQMIRNLQTDISSITKEKEKAKRSLKNAVDENEKLDCQVSHLQTKYDLLKSAWSATTAKCDSIVVRLSKEAKTSDVKVQGLQSDIADLAREKQVVTNENIKLVRQLSKIRGKCHFRNSKLSCKTRYLLGGGSPQSHEEFSGSKDRYDMTPVLA